MQVLVNRVGIMQFDITGSIDRIYCHGIGIAFRGGNASLEPSR
jgi:hypothetical protein